VVGLLELLHKVQIIDRPFQVDLHTGDHPGIAEVVFGVHLLIDRREGISADGKFTSGKERVGFNGDIPGRVAVDEQPAYTLVRSGSCDLKAKCNISFRHIHLRPTVKMLLSQVIEVEDQSVVFYIKCVTA